MTKSPQDVESHSLLAKYTSVRVNMCKHKAQQSFKANKIQNAKYSKRKYG